LDENQHETLAEGQSGDDGDEDDTATTSEYTSDVFDGELPRWGQPRQSTQSDVVLYKS
jgi:hypothetical protein